MNYLKNLKTSFAPLRLCGILFALGSLSNHAQTINDFQFGVCGASGNFETISPNGYHYVEPSTREITQPDKSDEDFAKHLNNLVTQKRNILVINGFISIKVVGPEKDHDKALAYAIKVFDRAKQVGVKKIVFGSKGSRTAPKDYPHEDAYREFTDYLKLIVPEAKKRGLIISLEPLTNCTLMPKIEHAARMCEDVKAPNVLGITADFWHMMNNKDDSKNLVKYAKHLKHIHLAEQKNRTAPGVSNQDLSPYWKALIQSGYTGLISIEGKWPKTHPLKGHHPKALQLMKEGLQKALDQAQIRQPSAAENLQGKLPVNTVSYNNTPLGTLKKPLLLRTYVPDPGLDAQVLANHHNAAPSPKYSPKKGSDVKGEYQPIHGIPAAIAINYGPHLSYVWDTTECRLLYAWKDGFLNMRNYWGTSERGNRTGFGYVPKLEGTLTHLATGYHPIHINGKPIGIPRYLGYTLKNNQPTFRWKANGTLITTTIRPNEITGNFTVSYTAEKETKLTYDGKENLFPNNPQGTLIIEITPDPKLKDLAKTQEKTFKGITVARGEHLFSKFSCQMCHTTDGGKSHGPTLLNLVGLKRKFGDQEIIATDDYLHESITDPNAKIVPGYQPNYMPKFPLTKDETQSLVLYLKTFSNPKD